MNELKNEIKEIKESINEIKRILNEHEREIKRLNDELADVKTRVAVLEERLAGLTKFFEKAINDLVSQNNTIKLILQYVVVPLLIILGSLVGMKITLPFF